MFKVETVSICVLMVQQLAPNLTKTNLISVSSLGMKIGDCYVAVCGYVGSFQDIRHIRSSLSHSLISFSLIDCRSPVKIMVSKTWLLQKSSCVWDLIRRFSSSSFTATTMARFARDLLTTMNNLTSRLEVTLGPDTGDLAMRIGLHSGPVTAGKYGTSASESNQEQYHG